jgi:hypothetical protein
MYADGEINLRTLEVRVTTEQALQDALAYALACTAPHSPALTDQHRLVDRGALMHIVRNKIDVYETSMRSVRSSLETAEDSFRFLESRDEAFAGAMSTEQTLRQSLLSSINATRNWSSSRLRCLCDVAIMNHQFQERTYEMLRQKVQEEITELRVRTRRLETFHANTTTSTHFWKQVLEWVTKAHDAAHALPVEYVLQC